MSGEAGLCALGEPGITVTIPRAFPCISSGGFRRLGLTSLRLALALSLSAGALRAAVVATDGAVPVIMNAGGTSGNAAQYIVGNAGAYTLDFGSSSELYVGNNNPYNSLIIQSGSTVNNLYGSIGGSSNYNSATVTGAGSLWQTIETLAVGYGSSYNMLLVTDGGQVSAKLGHIGSNDDADNNSVTISGSGSKWTNTNGFIVGSSGANNSLTINQGGRVTNTSGTIGNAVGADGNTVTVSGAGSTWASSTGLIVGSRGINNGLMISSGGAVSSTAGTIGRWSEGTGNTATVSGSGSAWTMTGDLKVGDGGGSSTLSIASGGRVSNVNGIIGNAFEAANNLVQVSGAGSTWKSTGTLRIGQLNTATNNILEISSQGLVSVDSTLSFGLSTSNVIRLDGGFLAWKGNHVSDLQTFIANGRIQNFVDGTWTTASASAFEFAYFTDSASALAFTGGLYDGLATYTVIRNVSPIPEPGTTTAIFGAIALGGGLWRRRGRAPREESRALSGCPERLGLRVAPRAHRWEREREVVRARGLRLRAAGRLREPVALRVRVVARFFLPPPSCLLTVAQARASAVLVLRPCFL